MSQSQRSIRDVVARVAPLAATRRVKIVVALDPDLEKRWVSGEFAEAVRGVLEWIVPKAFSRLLVTLETRDGEVILTIWGDASSSQEVDQSDLSSIKSQVGACGGSLSVSREGEGLQAAITTPRSYWGHST